METKRVLELIRVSTEGQAHSDRASIPSQRAINRRTAAAFGLKIVRSIEISDVSGTAVLRCPEILEMLELIKAPEIHGVVAREFSRLMRPEDFSDYYILQVFADTCTILFLPEGPIDFSNKMGRVYGVMQAAWAGAQRMEFLEHGWNSKEIKRRKGGFAQSRVCLPFGVAFDPSVGEYGKWSYTADAERVKECFRLFTSGQTSYTAIAKRLGLEPYNVKVFLKNPIYTGWRVVDKKRDMTPAGKYFTPDGRQGDRRKIARAPDEIIRVKVLEPLVSEAKFKQAQRLMELKRQNSWRSSSDYEHRFIYNGFLRCGECGDLIYTKFRRDDYYICKRKCGAPYQRKDRLEAIIDSVFAEKLTSTDFAAKIIRGLRKKQPVKNVERATAQLQSLDRKRERVLESFYEGVITSTERDGKLTEIDRERGVLTNLVFRPEASLKLTPERLARLFRPFMRFPSLNRDSKRRMLGTLAAEIVTANYAVNGLWIALNSRDVGNRTVAGLNATEGILTQKRVYLELEAA